ncbi:MAG TPA: hypothetical protein PKH26_13095 [Phycisphaerae bacterium]|nr:hypothetical protein [Phycisphaerae bacterium]
MMLGVLLLLCAARTAHAGVNIPPGFEIVHVTNDSDDDHYVQMNNCGEVGYTKYRPDRTSRIVLYDNGRTTGIPEAGPRNYYPDINDEGVIVWSAGATLDAALAIVRYANGGYTHITTPSVDDCDPRINNLGHITWYRWFGDDCGDARAEVFFYNGQDVSQVSNNGFSNSMPCINDADVLAWTRYNFCLNPWESSIVVYRNGLLATLPDHQDPPEPRGPAINNRGQVVWGGPSGIELWTWLAGTATIITPWGRNPAINNHGDIFFLRWHDDSETWQVWCYVDGMFYQLSDDPFWNTDGDINDAGEMAWMIGIWGSDVRMLRRIRNGDTDFDLDVDVDDYVPWADCLTGPVETDRLCDCRFLDMQHDRDVDLADFALFQNAMGTVVTIDDHNCCAAHYDPGCTHPDIMACVCAALPECCQTTWTAACAAAVSTLSCGECP